MRQKILLIAAAVFGLIAFYLTYSTIHAEKQKLRARTETVQLVAVRRDVPEGMEITIDDIVLKQVERFRNNRGNEILWTNRNDAIKQKADRTLRVGELLKYTDLAPTLSGKEGLAGIVRSGSRAISISVDATSSVTSLVLPGNHVDIIGTFRFPEMKGDQSLDVVTMTILQKVKIIATGKTLAKPIRRYKQASRSKGYSTVTLQLSPKEAEMIVFAAQKGKLTLSLRSYNDTGYTNDLQSVNFRYLQEHLDEYLKERKRNDGLR